MENTGDIQIFFDTLSAYISKVTNECKENIFLYHFKEIRDRLYAKIRENARKYDTFAYNNADFVTDIFSSFYLSNDWGIFDQSQNTMIIASTGTKSIYSISFSTNDETDTSFAVTVSMIGKPDFPIMNIAYIFREDAYGKVVFQRLHRLCLILIRNLWQKLGIAIIMEEIFQN